MSGKISFLNSPKFSKLRKAPLAISSLLSRLLASPDRPQKLSPPGGPKMRETGFKPGLKVGGWVVRKGSLTCFIL